MLKTFDEHGNPDHKKSYKVQKKLSNKNRERLKKTRESQQTGCSQQKLAHKFNVHQSTVCHEIKHQGCLCYKGKRELKTNEARKELPKKSGKNNV